MVIKYITCSVIDFVGAGRGGGRQQLKMRILPATSTNRPPKQEHDSVCSGMASGKPCVGVTLETRLRALLLLACIDIH